MVSTVGNHNVRSLTKESTILFIELLDTFRVKTDNKNYSYTCLELFWSIGDSVRTNPTLKGEEEIWRSIFMKLCLSATFLDAQVRNSSLQIYSSILFDYGELFNEGLWEHALFDLFFRVFDDVMEIYLNLRLQKGGDAEVTSPEAVQALKASFEQQKLKREKY